MATTIKYEYAYVGVGIIPTALNETITGMACGVWSEDCNPSFSVPIEITNCGSFFIYYLSSMPNCDTAYCAGLHNNYIFFLTLFYNIKYSNLYRKNTT